MVTNKSSDPYIQIYRALLCDVQTTHSEVFTRSALRLTIEKMEKRVAEEGLGFLTKTLPRLGKAFDRALSGEVSLDAASVAFSAIQGSKLPKFLGELFQRIFSHDGWILPTPCVKSIKSLRHALFVFYKLEVPYDERQEQKVLEKFERTDRELGTWNSTFEKLSKAFDADLFRRTRKSTFIKIIRSARILLAEVFADFDPKDIHPRHGPGAVSTRERLWDKYSFGSISPRILETYPLDAYFYASLGHVCDDLKSDRLEIREDSARVILVPKDSRGPRLISCEPLAFQWIQQGLGSAMVQHLEHHPLTRWSIHFSDQTPNRCGAALGSITGGYSTLDLNEASDRVSTELVRLLFPEPLCSALLNCRSRSTILPDGRVIALNKFAPMGSALCFPVLATVCWAILAVGLSDANVFHYSSNWGFKPRFEPREDILVYGDDIIVKTAQAAHSMKLLESFGLKINRDKSCTSGFFRESCGMDAYKGENVTPVRFRTLWSHDRCPEAYTSYIAYANSLYRLKWFKAYDSIVDLLCSVYGQIPEADMLIACPSLESVPEAYRPKYSRINKHLQKREFYVWDIRTPKTNREIGGWKMLLRYFAEVTRQSPHGLWNDTSCIPRRCGVLGSSGADCVGAPFSVRQYTKRKASCLVKRWR